MGVTNHWTETGLDWTHPKFIFRPFQRRTEAKHAYSLMHSLYPLTWPAEAFFRSFLESVEVKGHVHIYQL